MTDNTPNYNLDEHRWYIAALITPPDDLSADPNNYFDVGEKRRGQKRNGWSPNDIERMNDDTLAIEVIMEEVFDDWLSGNIDSYMPDSPFVWPHLGRDLTDEEVDRMMLTLYQEIAYELKPGNSSFRDWDVPIPLPAFPLNAKRYIAQRIAMVLDMSSVEGLKPYMARPMDYVGS